MGQPKFVKPLHLACGDDELRPVLSCIKILNGEALATNGHIVVRQMLADTTLINVDEIRNLEGKLINKYVWKELISAISLRVENDKIVVRNKAGITTYQFEEEVAAYPDIDKAMSGFAIKEVGEFGLTANFITVIAKIFQTERLKVSLNGADKGFMVHPVDGVGEAAYVMPVMLGD
jgi:hypothetical protein